MKIALIALPQEVSFAAAAVTSLNERYGGDAIDLFARTPDSFKTSGHVDEFLQFAGDEGVKHYKKYKIKEYGTVSGVDNLKAEIFARGPIGFYLQNNFLIIFCFRCSISTPPAFDSY